MIKRCYLLPLSVLPQSAAGVPRLLVDGKELAAPVMLSGEQTNYRWGWQGWTLDPTMALVTIWWELNDQVAADWWEAQPGVVVLPEPYESYLPVPAAIAASLTKALQPVPATFGEFAKTLPWAARWELQRP